MISVSGMSVDDALFSEQASTSLYERTDGEGARHVLSLARTNPEYCKLPTPPNNDNNNNNNNDNDSAPEIVVQLRKRGGKTQLFVDGYLSPGSTQKGGEDNVYRHQLTWHRGLHEDVETGTRVFSPIVVAAAVEDGQRQLQDVTVAVLRTFYNHNNAVLSSALLSEAKLLPHRVSDARCRISRAPYPLTYPTPPSVIVSENFRNERQQSVTKWRIGVGLLTTVVADLRNLMDTAKEFSTFTSQSEALADVGTLENAKRAGTPLAVGGLLAYGGYTALATALLQYLPLYFDSDLQRSNIDKWAAFGSSTLNALLAVINLPTTLPQTRTKFTIRELAATIRSIAVMRDPDVPSGADDESDTRQSTQYYKEMVVWEWLKGADVRPMDTSLLRVSERFSARLHLRIAVNDTSGCAPVEEYHEIYCGRDDCHLLGAAAAGTLADIEDLFDAVNELKTCIQKGIDGEAVTFYDKSSATLTNAWDHFKTNTRELARKLRDNPSDIEDSIKSSNEEAEKLIADVELDEKEDDGLVVVAKVAVEAALAAVEAALAAKNAENEADEAVEKANAELAAAEPADVAAKTVNVEAAKVAATAAKEAAAEAAKAEEAARERAVTAVAKTDAAEEAAEEAAKADAAGNNVVATTKFTNLLAGFKRTLSKLNPIGVKTQLTRKLREWLRHKDNPKDDKVRKKVLEDIKKALDTKICAVFFDPNAPGTSLMAKLYKALDDNRLPRPPEGCGWVRRLPQRANASSSGQLFASRVSAVNGYSDVYTERVVSRVYSEYHDADQLFAASMHSCVVALSRLVREWEAHSSTRAKLVCMCTTLGSKGKDSAIRETLDAFTESVAHDTLVLTTPVDVRVAGVLAAPTEHSQRQIRMVVKRAQQRCDKSVLEALGLKHNDDALLASQIFGDLWVDELVTLHELDKRTEPVQMLEQASRRAAARLRNAGLLLLELVVVHNPSTNIGDFDDAPFDGTDISLTATQRGRDAGRLVDRILFHQDYLGIRAALAPMLRSVARAAIECANVFEQRVPTLLPHEPTASLFGNKLDGVAAYARVSDMSLRPVVQAAAAAAYPSVRLLADNETLQKQHLASARQRRVPELVVPTMAFRDIVLAMRFRLAGLNMDVVVDNDETAQEKSVDDLARQLAAVDLVGSPRSFYVPFGFGDTRPAPTLPPCATPMFGSVPVFGEPLARAFESIGKKRRAGTNPFRVRLEPMFDCLPPMESGAQEKYRASVEGESVHPNVVQVYEAEDRVITVRYAASRIQARPFPADSTPYAAHVATATAAAMSHLRGADATLMASDVCSIAWNAERVMQAVIAAMASAPDDHDAVVLSFVHPEDDRKQSLWHTRPKNPITMKKKEKYNGRRAVITNVGLPYLFTTHHSEVKALQNQLIEYSMWKTWFGTVAFNTIRQNLQDIETQLRDGPNQTGRSEKLESWDRALADIRQKFDKNAGFKIENKPTIKVALDRIQAQLRVIKDYDKRWQQYESGLQGPGAQLQQGNRYQARVRNALVGALGVGMGMLAPLLGNVRVTCDEVDLEDDELPVTLQAAFGECEAMRLSEACLVVGSVCL